MEIQVGHFIGTKDYQKGTNTILRADEYVFIANQIMDDQWMKGIIARDGNMVMIRDDEGYVAYEIIDQSYNTDEWLARRIKWVRNGRSLGDAEILRLALLHPDSLPTCTYNVACSNLGQDLKLPSHIKEGE